MQTLKLGIVGSGFIANFQAQAIQYVRDIEITGLVRRRGAETLAAFVRDNNLGDVKIYESVQELAKHVDAIAIFVPNFVALEVMEEIAAAKLQGAKVYAVIIDKPLGRNLKEARRFVELAEQAKLLTAYFENQIHMKAIQAQKKQLRPQEQSMGPLVLARCSEEHSGPHMPWFWDPRKQGGGVLNDMGCHSIAVGWYVLTPSDKPWDFLEPISISCDVGLLKWGQPYWRKQLLEKHGVDYGKTPAEDFATGVITFRNPETHAKVKLQFSDSWMFDKQGLRLFMDGLGPGYAFEVNSLTAPLNVFISELARSKILDGETALEKSTSSQGLLPVHYNEVDLYGYIDENKDAAQKFLRGKDGLLSFRYGYAITRLVMAAYMAAERGVTLDLTNPRINTELESYIPLIQQGKGYEILS